jgi:hypothetical protein
MDAPDFLSSIRTALEPYDPLDLASGLGALQLVPENADHLLRLEVAAAAAAGLPSTAGRPLMPNQRWRGVVNGPPVVDAAPAMLEDPVRHPFTENLTFHGGSHVVLPGLEAEAPFILRQLTYAIFRLPPLIEDPDFNREAYRATRAGLLVSDAVAQRAGLRRNTAPVPSPHGTVTVPFPAPFERLQAAVSFTAGELDALLGEVGLGLDALDPLTCKQGEPSVVYRVTAPFPMLLTPIVRSGDRYVVASPGALLIALRHILIRLAIERGLRDELADRLREAIVRNVERSIETYLDCPPVAVPPFDFAGLPVENRYFAFDTDKVLDVIVVTDRLEEYDPASPFGEWDANAVVEQVQDRLREVEEHVFAAAPPGKANEILHLIVVQGAGRDHSYRIHVPQEPVCAHRLGLSACDLELFGLRVGRQPLALWKFAEAKAAARQSASIVVFDTLDEITFYLDNEHCYFHSDAAKPDVLLIPPGAGSSIRQEVADRFDFHAVPGPAANTVLEVGRIDGDLPVPSYVPVAPSERVQLVSEALPVLIWVVGPEAIPDERYDGWYRELARMVGYWLWQVAPSLTELAEALKQRMGLVLIRIEAEPSEAWFVASDAEEGGGGTGIACWPDGDEIHLHFAPSALRLFERPDNSGEREVVRALLRAFGDLAGGEPGGSVDALVDRHAPVGRKKMILRLRAANNRRLDDRDVDRARPIQEADVNAVLDETGRYLAQDQSLPVGVIAPDDRVATLDAVVDHQIGQLERLIGTLSPAGLLETLVAHNESLIRGKEIQRLTVPTRQACFADAIDVVEELQRSQSEVSDALVASRYLIEYTVACPPRGLRPISQSVLDRAIAIASEIVHRSMERDSIEQGLADPEMDMLPSGRLGVERGTPYESAMAALAQEYAFGEAGRSHESFHRHWETDPEARLVATLETMDEPMQEEVGLTFRQLVELLGAAMALGDTLPGAGKRSSLAEFTDHLAAALGWQRDQVVAGIEMFAARPRARFQELPPPYERSHLSAANFARPYSYLRKPLLLRPSADGDEVIWGNRNLSLAGSFLWNLLITNQYPARTQALRTAMSRAQQAEAEAFNDQVADLYATIPGAIVRTRVEAVGGRRIGRKKGNDLGDVDVLVVEPNIKIMRAIEVKDFSGARTPWEYKRELKAVFGSGDGQSYGDRHMERVRWLIDHRSDVLEWLGLPVNEADDWRVEPLLVLDKESPTPFLSSAPVPVVTYQRLKAELCRNQGL